MARKLTWTESFTTTAYYSAEITDEQAELFQNNPDQFFDEVEFRDNQDLVNERIKDFGAENFELEDEEN